MTYPQKLIQVEWSGWEDTTRVETPRKNHAPVQGGRGGDAQPESFGMAVACSTL